MSYWCCSDYFTFTQPRDWSHCLKNPSLTCHICGIYPLDEAISSHAPDEVILALLAGNTDATATSTMNENGGADLPLHKAMQYKCSDEVILALVGANKGAAMKESANGDLPLHQALKNGYSDTIAMSIFSAYPCAATLRCKVTGMLPLHLAAASSASPWLVEALIREYPEALEIVANGFTPRDLVTASLPVESIKMICRPSLFRMRNILSTQQQVAERVVVPEIKARNDGREMAVSGLTQLSKVNSMMIQTHPKCNRMEPTDWISKLSEVNPMNAQGYSKYGMEQIDRVLKLSEIYSVEALIIPNFNNTNPEDQIRNLSKVYYNQANPDDWVSKLSEEDSMKAQARACNGFPQRCAQHDCLDHSKDSFWMGDNYLAAMHRTGFPQSRVQHDYHDHSNNSSWMEEYKLAVKQHRLGPPHFPRKLYELLDSADSSAISWQPHGRAIKIHNVKKFVEKVMPLHFSQSKLESFHRQLNLYGFLRITQGRDEGAYYHELFLRGCNFLVYRMRRQQVEGTNVKRSTNPDNEPDFYSMTFVFAYHAVRVDQGQKSQSDNNSKIL